MSGLREFMKQWRSIRRVSQMELALKTGLSARHISFIETGRSLPSRDTLFRIADGLELPLRENNTLFLAAGYAPPFGASDFTDEVMDSAREALEWMLEAQNPYPALVMDGLWNVLLYNESARRLAGMLLGEISEQPHPNLMRLIFDPRGLKPFLEDWPALARFLLGRIHRETLLTENEKHTLLADLRKLSGPLDESENTITAPDDALPFVPVRLRLNDVGLSFVSMISRFAAPLDAKVQELRLESYFPLDRATRDFLAG